MNEVLLDQQNVLLSFRDCLDPQSHRKPTISCAIQFKLHENSIEKVLTFVDHQLFHCRELRHKAKSLAGKNVEFVQVRQADSARKPWGRSLGEAFHNLKGNATKSFMLERKARRPPSKLHYGKTMMTRDEDDSIGTADDDGMANYDEIPSILPYPGKGQQLGSVDPHSASKPAELFAAFFETPHPENAHDFLTAAFSLLWTNFPQKSELHNKVANPEDPGDGLVYSSADIEQAMQFLKEFYHAWHQMQAVLPCPPPQKLQETGKVCLILSGMRQEGMFEDFHHIQFTDSDLPLLMSQCRQLFEPDHPNCAETFVSEQYRVIPRPWNDGDQIDIRVNEPLPLKYERPYRAGSFGMVNRVCDAFSGEVFALKQEVVLDTESTARKTLAYLQMEAELLKRLRHRHVVHLAKTYRRGNTFGMLLLPPASTDLERLLRRFRKDEPSLMHGCRDSEWLRPILLQSFGCLSEGLAYLHNTLIRHRDIKPANILFVHEDRDRGRFLWADFGRVNEFENVGESTTRGTKVYPRKYASPEISGPSIRGRSADIFSLGCVFLEILAALFKEIVPLGEQPFSEALVRVSSWATKIKEQNNRDSAAQLVQLAIQMTREDPLQRPLISDVQLHLIQLYSANTSDRFFCDLCWKQMNPHEDVVGAKNPSVSQVVDELLRLGRRFENETVTFLVHWDLKQYVQEELESDFESKDFASVLENVLTISGTIEKAYASSLRDYIRWKWPNSKLDILENLKEVVQRTDKGELISLEFFPSRSAIVLLRSAAVWNTPSVDFGEQDSCMSADV